MENNKEVDGTQNASSEIDYATEYEKLLQENVKIASDRDNYKTGLLKAKGKIPSDEEENDMEARITARVKSELLSAKEADIQARKDELVKQSFAKVKELSLALKNPKGSPGQTSSTEGMTSRTDNTLSPDQIATLKAKGWDDKKIELFKKNLSKNR